LFDKFASRQIHLQSFFTPKDGTQKTEFFAHIIFCTLKNEVQINKTDFAMFNGSCQNKSVCQKLAQSRLVKKQKIGPFCTKAFKFAKKREMTSISSLVRI